MPGHRHLTDTGVPSKEMHNEFRGQCIYQAELDFHFPLLTMRQTLGFAAETRAPQDAVKSSGSSRKLYAENLVEVTAASMGLSKTLDTQMGNDFIQGVSGGERKRASIAVCILQFCMEEALKMIQEILAGSSSLQCWDNSTRGLDSANAFEFVKTLSQRTKAEGSAAVVSLYQASDDIYNVRFNLACIHLHDLVLRLTCLVQSFDKVVLLHEGRQIFFGPVGAAKAYFTALGFVCPERSTTADFLTSLTNSRGRVVRTGYQSQAPRAAGGFAEIWKRSREHAKLLQDIGLYEVDFALGGRRLDIFRSSQKAQKSSFQ
jgi:ATP-binding cassette, subfamily G (WHITE), member 2, PDR